MRSRRAIPPRMLEPPPSVQQGLELYMKAFWDLVSDRYELGHRIPWTARQAWCDAHDIRDPDECDDFHFLIGRLDIAYLQWQNKKSNRPTDRPGPPKEKVIDTRRVR